MVVSSAIVSQTRTPAFGGVVVEPDLIPDGVESEPRVAAIVAHRVQHAPPRAQQVQRLRLCRQGILGEEEQRFREITLVEAAAVAQ